MYVHEVNAAGVTRVMAGVKEEGLSFNNIVEYTIACEQFCTNCKRYFFIKFSEARKQSINDSLWLNCLEKGFNVAKVDVSLLRGSVMSFN